MKKKYSAFLALVLVLWVCAIGLYAGKCYAGAVRRMISVVATGPVVSAPKNAAAKANLSGKETTDNKTADKKSTDKKSADKKAADEKTSDKKTTDKKSADKKAADEKTSDKKTTDKKTTDKKTADKKTTDKKTADKKTADKKTTDKKTTDKKTTDKKSDSKSKSKNTDEKTTATESTTAAALSAEEQKKQNSALKSLNAAVSKVQKNKKTFTVTEVRDVKLEIKECSVEGLRPALDNIVKSYATETESVYNFVNGIATDSMGNNISVSDVLPPKYSQFAAAAYNVESVKKKSIKKGTEYTFNVAKETVTGEEIPFNHASTVGYIDFSKLDCSPLEITEIKTVYKKSVYKATVDKKGNLISVYTKSPVTITVTGVLGTDIQFKVAGTVEYNYKFEY